MGVTQEALADGKVLRYLVNRFEQDKTDEKFTSVLRCLRDSYVWIPCRVKMSEEDMKMFSGASVGDVVKSKGDIRLVPDTLEGGDLLFMPVFSDCEQMDADGYGKHFSKVEKHFFEAMSMAMAREDIYGIVLDAFTQSFVVPKDAFDFIGKLPSELDEE